MDWMSILHQWLPVDTTDIPREELSTGKNVPMTFSYSESALADSGHILCVSRFLKAVILCINILQYHPMSNGIIEKERSNGGQNLDWTYTSRILFIPFFY